MKTIPLEEFKNLAGTELGQSDWLCIDQERINRFADATDDHQFIHVDPAQAAKTPFGSTIAHGYLTLSLVPHLNAQTMVAPEGTVMGINYGSDKIRFLQAVITGSRVRSSTKVLSVREKAPGQWLMKASVTVEIEGSRKPALIAELLSLLIVL